MNLEYDFVIIGGGSAGYAAARSSEDYGLNTAVIDGSIRLGGLCILNGCMPSKTLLKSSELFRDIKDSDKFGINVNSAKINVNEIISRKDKIIEDFSDYRKDQLKNGNFDLIRGTASFLSEYSLEIKLLDDSKLIVVKFKTCLISTGSIISKINIPNLEKIGYLTSKDILHKKNLADSFTILGGGAIALEIASYLEGLGKKVNIIQRNTQILTGIDLDIAEELKKALSSNKDIKIFTGTSINNVKFNNENKKVVTFLHNDQEKEVCSDEIILALGRTPNTSLLNYHLAGIKSGSKDQITCNLKQQTNIDHIFSAGDVCGEFEVVHAAVEQGEIAAHNAAVFLGISKEGFRKIDYRLKLYGIFTHPSIAIVGLSENFLKKKNISYYVSTYPFNDHGKSIISGEEYGFVKMICGKNGEILGASLIGPQAVEIIHEIVVAMYFKSNVKDFIKIPHYHPTLSEIWTYPAQELYDKIKN